MLAAFTASSSSATAEDAVPSSSGASASSPMAEIVRGRVKDDSKSETFNKLWTYDEQRRLEELLLTYGPEEVEAKRWQKIAKALGNRTPQQVI